METAVGCVNRKRLQGFMKPAEIIKPPLFGTPADGYRMLFNYGNEVIVTNRLPVDVVFIGDSITQNWEVQGYFRQFGYIVNRRRRGRRGRGAWPRAWPRTCCS